MENLAQAVPENVEVETTYRIFELKDILNRSDAELESAIESKDADETVVNMINAHYESMIDNPEAFVGQGNNALVFRRDMEEEMSSRCVKCRWDFLAVNNKSKNIDKLPPHLAKLKRVEEYFEEIKAKTRALIAKGFQNIAENSALREAIIQTLASRLLAEEEYIDGVPAVDLIIEMERSESGEFKKDPFVHSETVQMIFMHQIHGQTLEEMLYEASEVVAESFDPEAFMKTLRAMVDILHKGGIAHRDLSIRNVMIDRVASQPHIIDFGKALYRSGTLASEDQVRDEEFLDQIEKLLRSYKNEPRKALETLKKMHKD